jgi:hypothetical protein
MKEGKIKYIHSKYDNVNKPTFKRKDSKQTKVILLIKDYFSKHKSLTKDKFDEFLIFIDLKSIWYTEEEQNILWKSLLSYSINKTFINYEAAFKGIMDLFKIDDDTKNNSNNNKSINEIKESFDKYIKNLKGNMELLYDIEFINNIYLTKDNIILTNKIIEDIINDIKIKYKFLMINENEIKNYFSNFKSNINKNIINYINIFIENIIQQNENTINNNVLKKNNNKNSSSVSFQISKSNNISFSFDHSELFDKLMILDKNIFDCMDSLIYFYQNKSLINLTKKYIQNYLLIRKNNIYDNLKFIIENESKRKISDSKISEFNDENYNNDNIKSNFNIDNKNFSNNYNHNINNFNLNDLENKESKNFSKKEIIYKKKGIIKSEKSYSNIFDINKKLNEDYKSPINNKKSDENSNKIIDNNNNEKILGKLILNKKVKHNRNKSDNQENLLSLNFNKKLKKNISYCNFNKLSQIKELEIFNLSNKGHNLSRNNFATEKKGLQTQRDDESLFLEGIIEDLNMFTFSDNFNEQTLLQTANLDNLEHLDEYNDIIDKGTPTLNPLDLESKELYYNDDYYDDFFKENDDKKVENSNKEKLDLSKCQNPNNFTFGKDVNKNNENIPKIKLSGDIDSNITNYLNNNILSLNKQNYKKFFKIGHYDFKYLYKNNNIKKLFNANNDNLNPMKLLSDEVYIISNNGIKKQKIILVISELFYYLLKSNTQMTCISKINNKSLKSISISSRNCNLIHFVFDKDGDIIIETYRRMEILKYIKEIIKEKPIKINISHNLTTKKKHGENESINLKKIKVLTYTPNFENAQKIGILFKYQENFFSSKFQEKLVVLCDLGLLYFEENEKIPKVIIPIIGTTIKFYIVQGSDKLYCFQLKTINEESYIFGSKIKKEIFDWIYEFSLIKRKYFLQLKEIEPNLVIHSKNKLIKQK